MKRFPSATVRLVYLALASGLLAGCPPGSPGDPGGTGGGGVATGGSGGNSGDPPGSGTGGAGNPSGRGGGSVSTGTGGGTNGTGGLGAGAGGGGTTATGGGAGRGSASETGGTPGGNGGVSGTGGRAAGTGGSTGGTGGAAGSSVPPGCVLPATVGFKANVRPFLMTGCGGGSCHVIDATSTVGSGGFDHAYDWITGGAHASSCPATPTPMRFQVVIAVINAANAPTCSRSRKMPPPDATGTDLRTPLTACQVATLQAWLNEPLVTQMHRADDSSPTTPYPMPPYN